MCLINDGAVQQLNQICAVTAQSVEKRYKMCCS